METTYKTPSEVLKGRDELIRAISTSISDLVEVQKILNRFESEEERMAFDKLEELITTGLDEIDAIKERYMNYLTDSIRVLEAEMKVAKLN